MSRRSANAGYWLLVAAGFLIELSGCATAADPGRMVFTAPSTNRVFPEHLRRAMCVRSVTGGEQTNPLWMSKVGNDEFRTALASSLDSAGLTAGSNACRYQVDANLLGLSQPSMGLDMTVTSHVNYKVYDPAGQPVLLETISAPYTAAFSEAVLGVVREKRANEGSIRASISQFLEKLQAVK